MLMPPQNVTLHNRHIMCSVFLNSWIDVQCTAPIESVKSDRFGLSLKYPSVAHREVTSCLLRGGPLSAAYRVRHWVGVGGLSLHLPASGHSLVPWLVAAHSSLCLQPGVAFLCLSNLLLRFCHKDTCYWI